ncbi:MAG: hypothetical protein HDR10_03520 [Lachnospiraceae bacterium]|nr:hypothetical protein [Lachnospiraceae bacterium]
MSKVNCLSEVIGFDESFKNSINLYLNLNNRDKVLKYIPTKSSVSFLNEYLMAVKNNKEQASLIIGPYGKGKSHLLLVLLAIVSMERNSVNTEVIDELISKIRTVDDIGEEVADNIVSIWGDKGRFLPVLITNTQGDLNQAFLYGLNDALKREGIAGLIPDTYFSLAIEKIISWEKEYPETYDLFIRAVSEYGLSISELKAGLAAFSKKELEVFTCVYPRLTSGSEFNPMVASDPLSLYRSVSEKLVDEFGYSGIYIVFDEFSKYIESQSGTASGANMKLLQDMCELANDSPNAQIFITMVAHKSIKEYGKYISIETINAFTGIEGRIIEKLFVTSSKNNYELIKNAIIKDENRVKDIPNYAFYLGDAKLEAFYQIPAFRSKFDKRDFKKIIFEGCYPLNPVSAYLLLNISEKVAQNERTLFTFISNDEPNSMARYIANHSREALWSISADLIYDYFAGLFKKEIINEHVHNEWLNTEYALSKCVSEEQKRIVKALAIFLIVNKDEEMPADENILALATGISNVREIVEGLIVSQVVYRKGSTNNLVFKTRAGSALKTEIKKQRSLKGDKVNYGKVFENITKKYYIIPRKYNADHAMTRYYRHEYMAVDEFLGITNASVLFETDSFADGKVLSLYSIGKIESAKVRKHIKELNCKKLIVVCPKDSFGMLKQALDYEILQEIKNNSSFTADNEILKRELPILEEDLSKELEECLYQMYEEDAECKLFYLNGESLSTKKSTEVEAVVNSCCRVNYDKTPLINNEMINRHSISTGQTKKARLNIIQAILEQEDNEQFYNGTNQEATIYRSLFCGTGIKTDIPSKEIKEVLLLMKEFIESCSEKKRSLKSLIDMLVSEPYGMRKGVLPIYLGYLLAQRNEDIVVYFSDMEVQITAEIIVNMCETPEDYALFMSKADLQKEKYIESLNILFGVQDNRNLSVNRIKNILICMQRWFRSLPPVTRNATDFSEYEKADDVKVQLVKIRKLLQKVDFNPYEELFVSLPEIFHTEDDWEETYNLIDKCKTAFDDYFDWVLQIATAGTCEIFATRKSQELYHVVREWHENQSVISRSGLHGGRITNLMSAIENLNVYNDTEVTTKLIKAVTDVYIENWHDASYLEYVQTLQIVKQEVESLKDQKTDDKLKLSFVGKNGKIIEKYYEPVMESTGTVLRNIIEDTLEEYDDLSINDRVAILLEMIEKVIG